jgi:sphinganine C4-monooxygenase
MRVPGNIHAMHHQLYTPYAFGALYNHWAEGFFIDSIGSFVAASLVGLKPKEQIFFYTFVTVKIVEDHCGFVLPWSPLAWFGRLSGSNIVYHTVHHQTWGMKVSDFPLSFRKHQMLMRFATVQL